MIIYDAEIAKAIADKEDQLPGVEYCNGFEDYQGMGVAVVSVYDCTLNQWRTFCADNLYEFQNLIDRHDLVAGFNNNCFDDQLMAANGVIINSDKSYDLLCEIWKATGLDCDYDRHTHGGYGLEAMCRANLTGFGKTGDGAIAPILWQRGQIGAVIDYCSKDVWLLWQLLLIVLAAGGLICPKTKKFLEIRKPKEVYSENRDTPIKRF